MIELQDEAPLERRPATFANGRARGPMRFLSYGLNIAQIYLNGMAVLRARWFLRQASALGPRVRLWGKVVVSNKGTLVVRDRARLTGTVIPIQLATGPGGTIDIGEHVSINYASSIGATELVRIGAHSYIGPYVMVIDNNFHRLEPEHRDQLPPSAPVIIGENVWLGARVIVLPGVTIGAGSAIGAGSVVTRDIPPRTFAAGVPAQVIRQL